MAEEPNTPGAPEGGKTAAMTWAPEFNEMSSGGPCRAGFKAS